MLNLRDLIYNYKQSDTQIPTPSSQSSQPIHIQQTALDSSDSSIFSPYKKNESNKTSLSKNNKYSNSNSQNKSIKTSLSINNRKRNNDNNKLENDLDIIGENKSENISRQSRYKVNRYYDTIPLIGNKTLFSKTYNETPEINDVSNHVNRQFIYFVPGMNDYHQFKYPKFTEGNITNWLRILCDQCYYGNDYNGAAMIYKVLSKLTPMNEIDIQRFAIMLTESTNSFTHLKQFAQEIMSSQPQKAKRKIDIVINGNYLYINSYLFSIYDNIYVIYR
jgi:hypothetical protein